MEPSHFLKSVLDSNSIQEGLEHIKEFAKEYLDCEHVCAFIADKKYENISIASYAFNILDADLKVLCQLTKESDYFKLIPEGDNVYSEIQHNRVFKRISDQLKNEIIHTPFASIFSFQLIYDFYCGTLIFCYPNNSQLTENKKQNCHLIRLHLEHLIEKIHFRKQLLKQTEYESLFNTLRIKDHFTMNHSYNVSFYASLLGMKLGLSAVDLEKLKVASLLHDIGKLFTPKHILLKPGRLTDEEFEIIREHPALGYELLKDFANVESILPIVRWHHERIDGSGYPDRLIGTEIPYIVKIVSLVDAFDAMTSTRVYRSSLNIDEVKRQLLTNAGTQFDENMTKQFLEVINNQVKINPYSLV
ncbi:HD-GYP domain-containing protein [Paenibacillus psychroresistens]|uniref:HD-GYP domain-containing protein n=1 Tax=Paenibacillus psychroresistens TaxID=1778678 RepID=A0A6B8RLX9_9BACL|nr:HD-GYP domain-containing protein [Paenibacillus psychroresistens]QGQ96535.1 HD-GYP domain-containing protein [Paenibacillus psychroresistens]